MNLPNALTLSRFFLTCIFAVFMQMGVDGAGWALFIFLVAVATDFADGFIARKYNLDTPFGRLMDPIADKFLIISAFFMLAFEVFVPLWMVFVIASREILVTASRLFRMTNGQVIPAEKMGKIKTVVQMITVIMALLHRALWGWISAGAGAHPVVFYWQGIILLFMVFSVIISVWSGISYFRNLPKEGAA